jgi:hypothetical protein
MNSSVELIFVIDDNTVVQCIQYILTLMTFVICHILLINMRVSSTYDVVTRMTTHNQKLVCLSIFLDELATSCVKHTYEADLHDPSLSYEADLYDHATML